MTMIHGENFKIMVGGQVVGMAKEAKFSIAEDDASTKEFSDPWRTPDIKQSWDISCDAMVWDAGDNDTLNRLVKQMEDDGYTYSYEDSLDNGVLAFKKLIELKSGFKD